MIRKLSSSLFKNSCGTSRTDANNLKNYPIDFNKLNSAMAANHIEDSDTAFDRGQGFAALGNGYELEAIEAFQEAIRLDPKKYKDLAEEHLEKLLPKITINKNSI